MTDTDVRLARLLRRSALLATLARVAAVTLLVGNVAMWIFPDLGYDAARLQSGLKPGTPISVTPSAFAFVLVVSTAHVGLIAAAMWDMARLFAGFS